MRAIDANVLVVLLVRDDQKQLRSAEEFIVDGAWVSQVVLAETLWVLDTVYGLDRRAIATTVEMLLDHRDLTVQDSSTVTAALGTFRKKPKVSFSDCLVLELARKNGHVPLGTFDRDLARAGGQAL